MSPRESLLSTLTICAVFCALPADAAPVTLPASAVNVKWQRGHLLAIEADRLTVRDREGKVLLSARPIPDGIPARSVEIRDIAMTGDREAAAAVLFSLPLGEFSGAIVFFNLDHPDRPAGYLDLAPFFCELLAGGGEGRLWCVGRDRKRNAAGRDYPVVRCFDRDGKVLGEFLPRSKLLTAEAQPGLSLDPWQPGPDGVPALLPAGPGRLLAWLPAASLLAEFDLAAHSFDALALRLDGSGRAIVSFALQPPGRLLGLFPRRNPAQDEGLSTLYELRVRDPNTRTWQTLPGFAPRPRGTLLIGAVRGGVVLWNRTSRQVDWVVTN